MPPKAQYEMWLGKTESTQVFDRDFWVAIGQNDIDFKMERLISWAYQLEREMPYASSSYDGAHTARTAACFAPVPAGIFFLARTPHELPKSPMARPPTARSPPHHFPLCCPH